MKSNTTGGLLVTAAFIVLVGMIAFGSMVFFIGIYVVTVIIGVLGTITLVFHVLSKKYPTQIKVTVISILILLTGLIAVAYLPEIKKELRPYYKEYVKPSKTASRASSRNVNVKGVWGIDISHHQRNINWSKMDGSNCPNFMFLKATEGVSHKDSRYKKYRRQAAKLNVPIGAYHFFRPCVDGAVQAKEFIKFADLEKGDLRPVLDFEVTDRQSTAKVKKELKKFIDVIVKEYGVTPIIYCPYAKSKKYLPNLDNMVIWAVDYNNEPYCNYSFWQKTDRFSHPAFKGRVDFNLFNGTVESLQKYTI